MAKHPIVPFLRPRVREYLSKKGESLRWFAKQVMVDYQKLYRLEAQELRGLSFFEASRILRFIEPSDYQRYLQEFYPEEVKDVSNLEMDASGSDQKDEALELVLASEYNYELYLFAVETQGASSATIEKQFGVHGLQLLNQFVEKGALTLNPNGGFIGLLDGNNAVRDEHSRAICTSQLKLVDFGLPGSFIGTHSKGLNLEGRKIVYKAMSDLSSLIFATIENPEYQGNEIVVASLFCGTTRGQQ